MKFYGSRFCQRCGRLFSLTAPSDRLCAPCEQQPEPAAARSATASPAQKISTPGVAVKRAPSAAPKKAPVKRQRASEKGRHRPPRPKIIATGKNSGPVTGQRTLPMLRALAAAPAGLTTPQLAEHAGSGSSWVNALGTTRQLMLKQERLGRVVQAGTAAGNRTRESVVWRITGDGERYVAEADAGQAREPAGVAGDCFFVLCMYDRDGGLTAAELHQAIAAENASLGYGAPDLGQVRCALAKDLARRGLVRQPSRDRWEPSAYGLKMLDVWVGD